MCRSLLQKLKDEQATAVRTQQYPATSCPVCFEDLAKPEGASPSDAASDASEARLAGAYKREDRYSGGASSSKADGAPSAPPLEGRPEYESLLGRRDSKDAEFGAAHKGAARSVFPDQCSMSLSPSAVARQAAFLESSLKRIQGSCIRPSAHMRLP